MMTDQILPAGASADDPTEWPAATDLVAVLKEQADGLRVELAQLKATLEQAKSEIAMRRLNELREANEALVVAALHSESIADAAVKSLEALSRSIHRDALTGTPNRILMLDRSEAAIAQARRHGRHIAVLFIDLDDFKRMNDTRGHATGDAMLQLAARRLEMVVRESDCVSRYGGDEFIVLLTDLAHASDAALIAEKILAALGEPAMVSDQVISLSASIGIALYPEDGEDAAALISHADAAMYRAKRVSGGSFWLYGNGLPEPRELQDRSIHSPPSADEMREMEQRSENARKRHLREANERLIIAAIEAEKLKEQAEDRQRGHVKFIALVAHELRNPLSPIRTAAELLKRADLDPSILGRLQGIIERQVAHMTQLIEDLLDGSRGGAGKFRMTITQVDMHEVISSAIDTCRSAMQKRHQHFLAHLPPESISAYGDSVRLAQIFSNLLDNASKYTPEGGNISLSMTHDDEYVVVAVTDDGIGLSRDALPHVFELFVQEERAMRTHDAGLGIGLAVVRELVTSHSGTVVALSAGPGKGSEFVVKLPKNQPAAPSPRVIAV
jgi:diguanylate cyclase (GGDEF)-like protein